MYLLKCVVVDFRLNCKDKFGFGPIVGSCLSSPLFQLGTLQTASAASHSPTKLSMLFLHNFNSSNSGFSTYFNK
ncbi:hypothetical protein H5410_018457 [Solanum commersonii]|uniref:Uncharacterized protein n=1 Tax=Solanum commersonii TaxID=4109 RepID=A0A9J6A271_SOLCO|nr:hypothetical protein H5410_018457 [Solanum commersonii]